MLRFLSSAAGYVLLAVAFAVAVVDGTRSIAADRLLVVPLGDALGAAAGPSTRFAAAQAWPASAQHALELALAAPASAVAALLAVVLLWLARLAGPRRFRGG